MRLIAALLLFVSLGAQALPRITVEKINGFEVHFVDVGRGNSVGVSFQVPYGTLHDSGRFLGRAHLLEHLMHVGTLKYPGYHAFDELLMPAGVESNANTSYGRTFYFAGAKDDQTELVVKVFLSMLGGLEMSPGALENERQVVINEIVEEGIPQQSTAFFQMPLKKLLPADHPWAGAPLGDRVSLQNLSKKDLQELYDQVYRPGIVKIAVHGNFSKPGFLEMVRELIRENVKASPAQNGKKPPEKNLAEREIRSLFSETAMAPESERLLYTHTPDFDLGMILLEADRAKFPANSQAMDFLVKYLGSELPGSFIHKLKTELGWITEGTVWASPVRGRQLLYFTYTMSESGKGHAAEINEIFFRGLKDAQDTDASADFLERTKKMVLYDTEIASRTVPGFMNLYGSVLNEEKTFAAQIEDVKSVSARDMRAVALLFRPDQALYEISGPEVPEMEFDPVYNRKFKIEDNRAALARYMEIMRRPSEIHFDPVIRAVGLGPKPQASAPLFAQSKPGPDLRERFTVDLDRGLPDTAVSLDFHIRPEGPGDLIALDLIMEAFNERYLAEQTYLAANYHVSLGSGRSAQNFTLTVSGEDGYSARALEWQLRNLAEFTPTPAELARAKERYVQARDADYVDAFSVQIAVTRAKNLIDPLDVGGMAARGLAHELTAEEIFAAWSRLRARAGRNLTAAGALNLEDLAAVRAAGLAFSNGSLNEADLARLKSRYTWKDERVEREEAFPKSKGDEAYALVRFYKGPPSADLQQAAAFQALAALLGNQVYIHNRGEQKLGYIHNASFKLMTDENYFLLLYGGTTGAENAAKTAAGWQYIFDRIKSGEIGDDEIADAISSVASSLARIKTSARELVAQYSGGLNTHGDPRIHRELLAAAKNLTPADVRESARKYLLGDGTAYTQLTLHSCEALLSP